MSSESGDDRPGRRATARGNVYRFAWGFYLLLAVAAVVWIGWRERSLGLEIFLEPSFADLTVDLAAGSACGVLLALGWWGAERMSRTADQLTRQLAAHLGDLDRSEVAALALLSGFSEELFFRGAVQGSWGIVIATLLFAALHLGPGPALRSWSLFAGLAGGLFGLLVLWRGHLLPAILAHVLVNWIGLTRIVGRVERDQAISSTP